MNQNAQGRIHSDSPCARIYRCCVSGIIFSAGIVLIWLSAAAIYRINLLSDRLATAYTASLVVQATPERSFSETLGRQILDSIGAKSVALKVGQSRHLLVTPDLPETLDQQVDLRGISTFRAIVDALETMLLPSDKRFIRVTGPAPMGGDSIEIVLEDKQLRNAMFGFSIYILLASLLGSGITATMIVFASNKVRCDPCGA